MSVFSPIDADTLKKLLSHYSAGKLISYQGVSGGAKNTTYSIETDAGRYILTVYESLKAEAVRPILETLTTLHAAKLPVPKPLVSQSGEMLESVFLKPASLLHFLPGTAADSPTVLQCEQVGRFLAQLHEHKPRLKLPSSRYGPAWRAQTASLLAPLLNKAQQKILAEALAFNEPIAGLPNSLLHGALFRNNTLFEGNHLSGVIDFYFCCHAPCVYDLAVALNEWATTSVGTPHLKRETALIKGYCTIRFLTQAEQDALPHFRILAALRFWLACLESNLLPMHGNQLSVQNSEVFEKRLCSLLK